MQRGKSDLPSGNNRWHSNSGLESWKASPMIPVLPQRKMETNLTDTVYSQTGPLSDTRMESSLAPCHVQILCFTLTILPQDLAWGQSYISPCLHSRSHDNLMPSSTALFSLVAVYECWELWDRGVLVCQALHKAWVAKQICMLSEQLRYVCEQDTQVWGVP